MMRITRYIGPVIGGILLAVVLAKCAHMKYEDIQLEARDKAEKKQEVQRLIASINQLALQERANVHWAKQLAGGERYRHSPILTAEVQETLIQGAPILFIGVLRDVAMNSDGSFKVVLQYEDGYQGHSFSSTQIHLDARCSEELAAPLLKLGRNPKRTDYFPDAAVVARIMNARTEQVRASDGVEESRLTAVGECLATRAFSARLPRDWMTQSSAQ